MKMKRALDLLVTIVGSVVWVPTVLVAALLNLLMEGRPVLYRSKRRVSMGEAMEIIKFRTMVRNAAEIINRGTVPISDVRFLNVSPDSPLYTRFGRLLERVAITELPQFVHVLSGRMSLVGNRPLPQNVVDCLLEEYPDAEDRFLTPSGLTGPAQLVGRTELTDAERLALEIAYCRTCRTHYSPFLDIKIVLYTVMIVLKLKQSLTFEETLELVTAPVTRDVPAPALASLDQEVDEAVSF